MVKNQDPHSFKVHYYREYDMPFRNLSATTFATPNKASKPNVTWMELSLKDLELSQYLQHPYYTGGKVLDFN